MDENIFDVGAPVSVEAMAQPVGNIQNGRPTIAEPISYASIEPQENNDEDETDEDSDEDYFDEDEPSEDVETVHVDATQPEVNHYVYFLLGQIHKTLTEDLKAKVKDIHDKKELNKIILSHDFGSFTDVAIDHIALIDKRHQELFTGPKERILADLNRRINSRHSDIYEYHNHVMNSLAALNKLERDKKSLLNEEGPKLSEAITEILKSSFYKFHAIEDGQVYFTTAPVVVTHVNVRQAINMTVDLGRVQIIWRLEDNHLEFQPYENNLRLGDYWHPHCGVSMCFGNGLDAFRTAMNGKEPWKAFQIVESILKTYNPDSPFKSLDQFWAARNPEEIAKGPFSYRTVGTGWFFEMDANRIGGSPVIIEEGNGLRHGSSHPIKRVRLYSYVNSLYGVDIDNKIYLKSNNGRYFEIEDRDRLIDVRWV